MSFKCLESMALSAIQGCALCTNYRETMKKGFIYNHELSTPSLNVLLG